MATVTNWVDHLSAAEPAGAVYPGVGSEGVLVLVGIVIWIGWHIVTNLSESKELKNIANKRHGPNDYKSNITEW